MAVHNSPESHPAKCPLDDPAFGKYLERVKFVSLHYFKCPGSLVLDPFDELPGIAAIRPDKLDAREAPFYSEQKQLGSIAVLNRGRMDYDANQQAQDIDDNVALDAFDLFPGVITGVLGPRVGLY